MLNVELFISTQAEKLQHQQVRVVLLGHQHGLHGVQRGESAVAGAFEERFQQLVYAAVIVNDEYCFLLFGHQQDDSKISIIMGTPYLIPPLKTRHVTS